MFLIVQNKMTMDTFKGHEIYSKRVNAHINVYGVHSLMYNLAPVGKYFIQFVPQAHAL